MYNINVQHKQISKLLLYEQSQIFPHSLSLYPRGSLYNLCITHLVFIIDENNIGAPKMRNILWFILKLFIFHIL